MDPSDPNFLQLLRSKIEKNPHPYVSFSKPIDKIQPITGRIYIDKIGINAQISFKKDLVKATRLMLESIPSLTARIPTFNFALSHNRAFKKLHVRIRPLVSVGQNLDLDVLNKEPEYLTPSEWHNELSDLLNKDLLEHNTHASGCDSNSCSTTACSHTDSNDSSPVLIDMRNFYENKVGTFKGAICPDVDTFREEMSYIKQKYSKNKKKSIYMYCTGGIRCSVAGAILKNEGFENVKTLRGGVIAYGQWIKSSSVATSTSTSETIPIESSNNIKPNKQKSLFIGKNFTFDKRLGERVTSDILSNCHQCNAPSDTYTNCANKTCNILFIQCPACMEKYHNTCGSSHCIEQIKKPAEQIKSEKAPTIHPYRHRIRPELVFGN
ncbi:UPF0176 protein [Smittium culicis]|uniref:UPF0176 protein n=1 Tax=Smittium culicis TaxID=133412 RepID=A0A1R1YB31_9FUNG|nr:UPF0176 protein [Smittium culicis]